MPDTPERDAPRPDTTKPRTHSARDVSQGEIILRTRRRKAIFIGGLVAIVLFAMIWTLVIGAAA